MLGRVHPLPKLVFCLLWIAASLAIFDLRFQIGSLALAAGLLVTTERVRPLTVLALAVPFALFGFGFLSTSLLFDRETGFAAQMAREQALARPDAAPGLVLFFRALACGMVSALFALTTDAGALVRALMAQARLPASVGYALLQAMHLVPDVAREAQAMRMARAMRRGRAPGRIPTPWEAGALAVPLLAYAIRRAGRTATAMEARGFRPGAPRTLLGAPPPTRRDWAFCAGALGLLAAAAAACALS